MTKWWPIAALSATLLGGPALARDYTVGSLTIGHPFARPTPPGGSASGAYLTITNNGKEADRLLRVKSPVAGTVELHEMKLDKGVMRMREVEALEIRPHQTVTLKPGGYHVMLMNVKPPLRIGDQFPLTLVFAKAGSIDVSVPVEVTDAKEERSRKR